jgi:hypothetical protein
LGITGSIMIISRGLQKLDITRKKKSPHATEQDRPEVQKARRSFRRKVKLIEPKRLVFVDETGVTTAITPAYSRGIGALVGHLGHSSGPLWPSSVPREALRRRTLLNRRV